MTAVKYRGRRTLYEPLGGLPKYSTRCLACQETLHWALWVLRFRLQNSNLLCEPIPSHPIPKWQVINIPSHPHNRRRQFPLPPSRPPGSPGPQSFIFAPQLPVLHYITPRITGAVCVCVCVQQSTIGKTKVRTRVHVDCAFPPCLLGFTGFIGYSSSLSFMGSRSGSGSETLHRAGLGWDP